MTDSAQATITIKLEEQDATDEQASTAWGEGVLQSAREFVQSLSGVTAASVELNTHGHVDLLAKPDAAPAGPTAPAATPEPTPEPATPSAGPFSTPHEPFTLDPITKPAGDGETQS